MVKKIKKYFERFELQDYLLAGLIIILCIAQLSVFLGFKHLPGPIFGGDVYRERGFIQTILNGVPFWESPYTPDEFAFFPWLSYVLIALIVKILPISLDTAMNIFPVIITVTSMIGMYFIGRLLFKNKNAALVLSLVSFFFRPFYDKTTMGLAYVLLVWMIYFWLRFEEFEKVQDGFLAGLFLGLVALSHGSVFINAVVIVACVIAFYFILDLIKSKDFKKMMIVIKEYFLKYYVMILTAVIVSLLFFGPLMFKYQMNILNNSPAYALGNIDNVTVFVIIKAVFNLFFDISNVFVFIIKIIALVGLIACFMNINKKNAQIALITFFGTIIATMHFFITKPLFDRFMEPWHIFGGIWFSQLLFFAIGVVALARLFKSLFKVKEDFFYYLIILFIMISILMFQMPNYNKDQWANYGKNMDSHTQSLYDLGDWLIVNMENEETVLSNDESSFMINAVSGKRVVFSRRVHASYFEDVDKKYADGVVMLFGQDKEVVKSLLKEYNVRYVYIDQFLFNPVIVNVKYKDYLLDNGINFSIQTVRWDPSTLEAPAFESLIVNPNDNKDGLIFDSMVKNNNTELLHQKQAFYTNGQVSSIIYEVN